MTSHSVTSSRNSFPSIQQWGGLGVLSGGIFAIDLLIPLGVATGVLYLIVILVSLRQQHSQLTIWSAVICSSLTIIALFLSPAGGELWKILVNRALALFLIWTTTIMGRVQLQQAGTIQQQEKSMEEFMRILPSACFSFDRQGNILSWNPAAEKIYGYTEQEAVGASSYDLIVTPETKEQTQIVIDKVFQGKTTVNQVWHDQNKQGELGWRAGSLFPIFSRSGQVAYGININVDITLQKAAETNLQTQKLLVEAILDSSSDAIYAKNHEGKYLLVNQAAADAMGRTPESAVGLDDIQIFGSEIGSILQKTDAKIFSHGQPILLEEKVILGNKSDLFSTTKSPLKTSDGKTFALVGISRNITEWKQAQQDLLLTHRVFMASNDHISILGRDYRYRRVNPSYQKIHSGRTQKIVGKSVSEILGKKTFEQTVKPKLDQCFLGKEIHYEAWFHFADDQDHYMAVSYLPLQLENKDIQEIVVIARDWTERKRMEEALHTNQQQLRTILDAMTNFIGIGNVDGTITDCNQAPLTLSGLAREDVIGKPFTDTDWLNYSPKTQEHIRSIIRRVSRGEIVREDYQARMGENLIVTIDGCFVPVKGANGQVQQIVHSGIDVTERRQAERALHESEEQFRDLYESAPLAYFSSSWDGYITRVNSRASELLGYSQQELLGKQVLTLYSLTKDGYEKASAIQTKTQEGISVHDEELEMIKKDGTTLWVSLTVRLIFDDSGKITERRGMVQNISDRKRIESELRTSEYRYRSLVKTAGSVIIGITLDGWIVEWNREAERLYGKTREEALDTNYFNTFIQETDRLHVIAHSHKAFNGTPIRDFEYVVLDDAGEKHTTLWNIDRLLDENGQPYGLICIGRDITQWKLTEEQLRRSEERLSMALEASSSGTWDWNIQTGEVVTGGEWLKSLGYQSEDLAGNVNAWKDIVHPDDFPEAQKAMAKHFAKQTNVYESINRVRMKNGQWRWNYDRGRIVEWTTNGKPLRMVGTDTDITARKNAEEARRNSDYRFRNYFETGLVGMAITTRDKAWLEVNDRLCSILGYSREELHQKTWAELTHAHDLPLSEAEFSKLLSGLQNSYSLTQRFIRKDGSVLFANIYAHAVHTPSGKIDYITAMVQDITEQKEAEVRLMESQAWIAGIVDIADDAIIAIDDTQRITLFNQGAERMFGYRLSEIIGQPLSQLLPDQFGQSHQAHVSNFVESPTQARRMGERTEVFGCRKNGQVFPAEASISKLKSSHGITSTVILRDITQAKEAQEAMAQLAAIVVSSEDAIMGKDLNGIITYWNQSAERMFGYTSEEVIGQSKNLLLPPDRPTEVMDILTRVQNGEIIHHYETLRKHKDGRLLHIALSVSPVRDQHGKLVGATSIARDISDQKKHEQALRESERFAASTMNALSAHICVIDKNGDIVAVNKAWEDFAETNKKGDENLAIGKNYLHVCNTAVGNSRDDAQQVSLGIQSVLHQYVKEFSHAYPCHLSHNDQRWFSCRVTRFPDPGPIRLVIAHEDITALKMAQATLQKRIEDVHDLYNKAPCGYHSLDASGRYVEVNDTELEWLGRTREDVLGRPATDFLTSESRQQFPEIFSEYVKSGEITNLEATYRRKDGTFFSALVNATTVRNAAGEFVRSRATILDISERKSLEDAIRRHNIELEEKVETRTIRIRELEQRRMQVEKLAALAQIAAGVAHEINNPLASISQSLVLLKRAISKDHPHHHYLAKTEDCIHRIATITKNLYQLYRPSGPTPGTIDLRTCIRTATEIMEDRASKHGVHITTPSLSEPILTQASQSELIQVLCNLLQNAIDASPKAGRIEMSLTTGPQSLHLSVADQGIGISPEATLHIFEPFFTTKQHYSEGGMGLGLSISHSLVESMGGTLDFSTSLGQGSTFTITLPFT